MRHFSIFVVLTALSFGIFSGCATTTDMASEERILLLSNQVQILDQALRESQAQLAMEQQKNMMLEQELGSAPVPSASGSSFTGPVPSLASLSSNIYKTPSGFELPAKDIQIALKNSGFYSGAIDGRIGPASRDAIRAFQQDQGLKPDGVVGPKTWSKLKMYSEKAG